VAAVGAGAGAARGTPWQSHVAVHVGEHVVAAGAGVGATRGTPWQSHVAVHVGEHVVATGAGAMGLPEQSQVDVHCGEHLPLLPTSDELVDVEPPPPVAAAATMPPAVVPVVVPVPLVPAPAAPTSAFLATGLATTGAFTAGALAWGVAVWMGGSGAAAATLESSAVTTPASLPTSQPARATRPVSEATTTNRHPSSLLRMRWNLPPGAVAQTMRPESI